MILVYLDVLIIKKVRDIKLSKALGPIKKIYLVF
jgi:hypothetical protein